MAFRDTWHRALVYFGLAEERDPYEEEEPAYEPEAELEGRYRERPNVRRLSMGTSQDYLVAVQEGATIVRLGTTLYR